MKKLLLFASLISSTLSFTACSNDDNSNHNNIIDKKLVERTTYIEGNDYKIVEYFSYNSPTGYTSERKTINSRTSDETISKYEYSNNTVIEKKFVNNKLTNTNLYTLNGDTYTIKFFNSDNILTSENIDKISNKRIVSSKKYDSKGNLIYNSLTEYKNDYLTQIETESISKTTTISNYISNKIKNFNTPFAYIVTNDQPLNISTEYRQNENIRIVENKYEFDKDCYPTKITLITPEGDSIVTVNVYSK